MCVFIHVPEDFGSQVGGLPRLLTSTKSVCFLFELFAVFGIISLKLKYIIVFGVCDMLNVLRRLSAVTNACLDLSRKALGSCFLSFLGIRRALLIVNKPEAALIRLVYNCIFVHCIILSVGRS